VWSVKLSLSLPTAKSMGAERPWLSGSGCQEAVRRLSGGCPEAAQRLSAVRRCPWLSSKGLHRFIGDEIALVNVMNRYESPTVQALKAGGEGSSERPSCTHRTAAQTGLQLCICASWWYAKWTTGATMACGVPASHLTIVRICARFRV